MKQTAPIPSSSQKDGITCLSLNFDKDSDGWFLCTHTAAEAPVSEELSDT